MSFLSVSTPIGKLKFLIDTAATHSVIKPQLVKPLFRNKIKPTYIKSLKNNQKVEESIVLKSFKELGVQNLDLEFLIYDFHDYYDGLIGKDALKKLKATIDTEKDLLIVDNKKIQLETRPTFSTKTFKIPAKSRLCLKLPVNEESGQILIPDTYIDKNLFISEGLYEAKNWTSIVPVYNNCNEAKVFQLAIPLITYPVQSFAEFNFSQIHSEQSEMIPIEKSIRTDHLNSEEKKEILKICKKYSALFHKEGDKLSFTNQIKHKIKTTDDQAVYSKIYRYPYIHKEEIQKQINKLLEQGIIRPSFSPWSSPIWVVAKKLDASGIQKWRLVIDYRKLNAKTINDKYPIPNISDILDKLGRAQYFSVLDLASGFHQIEIDPKDICKTAFSVDQGHYEFCRMPFGLKNGPATFQRVMDNVLKDLIGKSCLCYMDDVIIFGTSLQEHIVNLNFVFKALKESNFKIQLDKCEFLRKELTFLGHVVTNEGIKPDPKKIQAIKKYPIPKNITELQSFLGLIGYYRKFIKDFAKLAKPLTNSLKKKNNVEHTEDFVTAFETCKHLLVNEPILKYPDFNKRFILTTDASDFALGAVLSQRFDDGDHPICYASRTLNESEIKYSTYQKELLAIIWSTSYFRPYLYGREFDIITDHQPLQWLMTQKNLNPTLIRWKTKLEEFDFTVRYKPGKQNSNADALSRIKIDINNSENFSIETNHSADEDDSCYIRISEKPLNYFLHQIIITNTGPTESKKTTVYFQKHIRITINISDTSETTMIRILKENIMPNKLFALYIPDNNLFLEFQEMFVRNFSSSNLYKLVRCVKLVEDITTEARQEEVIRNAHNNNGHRGRDETILRLQRDFFFPKMMDKVSKFINFCNTCQLNKYDRHPPKLQFAITQSPTRPLEICHADIFYYNKNNPFLSIIDKFSKYAQVFPLITRNTIHIKAAFVSYFCRVGKPKHLVADQEGAFASTEFKSFCESQEINLHLTASKSSNSNAPVERFHSTLLELLRILETDIKYQSLSVKSKLEAAAFFYNNAIHATTKFTPFELFHGRKYDQNLEPKLEILMKFQNDLYDKIAPLLHSAKVKKIEKLNQNRNPPQQYCPEQFAFVKKDIRTKLTPRFRKVQISEDNRLTVIDKTNRKLHKNKLRRNFY